jgi:3-oxoacyl-[acyl-carrier protein] reductase
VSSRSTGVAVVTGAARGLGEAIARRLHADGYRVALADIDADGADRVASELGAGALGVRHDIRDPASWERLLGEVRTELGDDVHALVNNAARTEVRSFWEIDVDEWDDVLATNLRGTYLGCRVVGAYLRDRGQGRIVNLASVAGQAGRAVTGVHYATSKAAIVALTRLAATELAPHGVTVNAVAPAAIDGPMVASVAPERIEAMLATIPVGRLGRPEEVAGLVAYLLSDEAGFTTGATFDVNGGMLMR